MQLFLIIIVALIASICAVAWHHRHRQLIRKLQARVEIVSATYGKSTVGNRIRHRLVVINSGSTPAFNVRCHVGNLVSSVAPLLKPDPFPPVSASCLNPGTSAEFIDGLGGELSDDDVRLLIDGSKLWHRVWIEYTDAFGKIRRTDWSMEAGEDIVSPYLQ